MSKAYVHGYDPREASRLQDQATTLVELLHSDTAYPEGRTVLEAGCGVGAQTVTLARNSPEALITSIDVSEASVTEARRAVEAAGVGNVTLRQADIFNLPFAPASFDHIFLCFVLEHLARPIEALRALKRVLKAGGSITAIEGDHGSAYFHPDSEFARRAVQCQVERYNMSEPICTLTVRMAEGTDAGQRNCGSPQPVRGVRSNRGPLDLRAAYIRRPTPAQEQAGQPATLPNCVVRHQKSATMPPPRAVSAAQAQAPCWLKRQANPLRRTDGKRCL